MSLYICRTHPKNYGKLNFIGGFTFKLSRRFYLKPNFMTQNVRNCPENYQKTHGLDHKIIGSDQKWLTQLCSVYCAIPTCHLCPVRTEIMIRWFGFNLKTVGQGLEIPDVIRKKPALKVIRKTQAVNRTGIDLKTSGDQNKTEMDIKWPYITRKWSEVRNKRTLPEYGLKYILSIRVTFSNLVILWLYQHESSGQIWPGSLLVDIKLNTPSLLDCMQP